MRDEAFYEMLNETTEIYRKGDKVKERSEGGIEVVEIDNYPHKSEAPSEDSCNVVDMVFVDIAVDEEKAKEFEEEFLQTMNEYPEPERLKGGPSYIELAGKLGVEQGDVFKLMALGETLDAWEVIHGKTLGMDQEEARELAGKGFLMISGYNPE